MENFIIVGIIAVIVALILFYIYKSKKSGNKCIGCPYGKVCGNKLDCCKALEDISNNKK